jgi:hypothetical protein
MQIEFLQLVPSEAVKGSIYFTHKFIRVFQFTINYK